jgi:hypothetical protein
MSPTFQASCRIDYRPTNVSHFCEYSGRVACFSVSGCAIQGTPRPDPDSRLGLRLSVPGSAWPIRVCRATVTWSHWDEFTVGCVQVPVHDQEPLQHCLARAQALAAVSVAGSQYPTLKEAI